MRGFLPLFDVFRVVYGLLQHAHELVNVLLTGHDGVDVGSVQEIELPAQVFHEDVGIGHSMLALGHQSQ